MYEITKTEKHWGNRLRETVHPDVFVGDRPAQALVEGVDGRLKIRTGHFDVVANLRFASNTARVRVKARSNARKTRFARKVLSEMGVAYEATYSSLGVLLPIDRATLTELIERLRVADAA